MSDYEYDERFDELKKLESETNFKLANSPTMTVGFDVVDKYGKRANTCAYFLEGLK